MKKYNISKNLIKAWIFLLPTCFISTNVFAATATGTLAVTANVAASCTVTAAALGFGNYTGSLDNDAQSTITVICTNGSSYNIGLNAGAGSGANTTVRKMTSTLGTLNYALYRDNVRTQNWGTTIGTDTVSGTGSGSDQSIPVYGRIPASQISQAGSYSDTVQVIVTF